MKKSAAELAKQITGDLMTEGEAAHFLRVEPSTLKKLRMKKNIGKLRPPWVTLGKLVRYSRHDLEAWVAQLPRSS